MSIHARIALLAIAATVWCSACNSMRAMVDVRETTTQAAAVTWSIYEDKAVNSVRTVENGTELTFKGKPILFEGMKGWKGRLTLDEIDVEIALLTIHVDESVLSVRPPHASGFEIPWSSVKYDSIVTTSEGTGNVILLEPK
ncbi:MAG: hypothetical protein HUU29_01685 [Planctomycetaceae bacterium]|nr:hypothetical protein [Planctomycetaceae bacterium]